MESNGFDPKGLDLNKCNKNSSKDCVLEIDLEYPKELHELHNDYPLAPDKREIKREILSNYQLKIANFWNIPIGNAKKLVFQKELTLNKTNASKECMLCHYWYFKDVGFKFEPHVCNKCCDILMYADELKNIAILSAKGADFRCISWGISRDAAVNRFSNSVLEDKGVL